MALRWSSMGKCKREGCERPFTEKEPGVLNKRLKGYVHVDSSHCGPEQREKK